MDYYKLDSKKRIRPCSQQTWAKFHNIPTKIIVQDTTNNGFVSTVFLGLNHQFSEGPPLIFETMIFGGTHDDYMARCTTYKQAQK
jgi:hypothetical protein